MESSILSEVDDTSFSGRGSPRRYGRPLNWLPASRLLLRAAGWSAATLCDGPFAQPLACTLNHLFLVARRLPLAILGHRAQIFYRSRMVPRLLAWTEAMLSQPLACVLAI